MYAQHFNFSDLPFSIAPNPRYVYLSPQHREALAHLLYGIGMGGGFVALTGEVGTGKTTLCRCLVEQLPEDVDIAVIFNPRLSPRELVASICDELRIPRPQHRASLKLLIDLLNHYLLDAHARGRRTVLLIDEAQNLNYDVLEQIRLLTNLETNDTKLLQIILVGQPELNTLLQRQNLRQLSQRISARYHLRPLSFIETVAYIRHRVAVSGGKRRLFSTLAEGKVYRLSGGIPRVINLICDRALLGAYALGRNEVSYSIVRKAAREVLPTGKKKPFINPMTGALAAVALTLFAGFLHYGLGLNFEHDSISERLTALIERAKAAAHPASGAPLPAANARQPPEDAADGATGSIGKPAPLPEAVASNADQTQEDHLKPADQPEPANAPAASIAEVPPPGGVVPAADAKPAPLAEPGPSFAKLVAGPNLTRKAAFAHLFALWHLEQPQGGGDECALAKQNGLRCLFQKGEWSQLRRFDHPAVLEFVLPDGSKRYATLVRILDDKVQLLLGDGSRDFELADILPFWQGDAVLLWKPPGNSAASIKPGDHGEAVKWLRNRLGVTVRTAAENYFDENLRARVTAFQVKNGLVPDGIVGPQTMIHLNDVTDVAVPRLGSKPD